jgi:hypothetical protein
LSSDPHRKIVEPKPEIPQDAAQRADADLAAAGRDDRPATAELDTHMASLAWWVDNSVSPA